MDARGSAVLFSNFVENTIVGLESALFKVNIPSEIVYALIPDMTANYFNQCYDGLANKTDPYIIEKMGELQAATNHAPLCLFNALLYQCIQTHTSFDRSHLVIDQSYEAFMDSVKKEFTACAPKNEDLVKLLDHECTGDKEITPLPEGQVMFSVKIRIKE